MTARRLRWILAISVMVNLVVLGAVGGALLSPDAPVGARAEGTTDQIELTGLVRGLEREDRRDLMQSLRRDGTLRDARQALQTARRDIRAVLSAESFDRAAFEDAIAAQKIAQDAVMTRGLALLADRLERMSPQARQALIEEMGQGRRRSGN